MTGLSDVWGLEFALTNKADRRHSHTFTDIDGLIEAIQQIQGEGPGTGTLDISSIEGLSEALNGKANTSHGHSTSQVADLDNILVALQDSLNGKAATSHTHQINQVSGLQTALDGKAASEHTHSTATSSTAGFMSAADKTKLDGLGGSFNPTIADVQGLQTALDGKAATTHTHTGMIPTSPQALPYTFSQSSVYGGNSTYQGSYTKLTDGSLSSGAGTNSDSTAFLKADLGSIKVISRIAIGGGPLTNWGNTASYLNGAILEVSIDDTNWDMLIPSLSLISDTAVVYFAVLAAARYVRIRRNGNFIGIMEFAIYG